MAQARLAAGSVSGDDPLRGKILDVVVRQMRRHGASAVTTDSVASAAAVSKSSIYRRWPSMGKLVAEAAAHAFPRVEVPDLGDTLAELRHFLEARVQQYSAPGSARLVASLIGAAVHDENVEAFFRSWVDDQARSSRAVFERAIQRGDFDQSLNIDDLRTIMSAPIMFRAVAEHGTPNAALVNSILRVIEAAMRAPRCDSGSVEVTG